MLFVIKTEKNTVNVSISLWLLLTHAYCDYELTCDGFFPITICKKELWISVSFSKAEGWGSVTLLKIGIFTFCEEGYCSKSTNILPTLS